jgi:DNA-binding MarR family transcriptional regulator
MTQRKHIKPGTHILLQLSTRERDLIVERVSVDPEVETRLRTRPVAGAKLAIDLTLDDIDDLHGCVAAEANHCHDSKRRRVLDALCDRLSRLLDDFTDDVAVPALRIPVAEPASPPRFTAKQGQYLAFIHHFTMIHRRPPAEADLQGYFRVSPPAVHQMILTLERRGLISREPGKARSVTVQVLRADLPELE